MHCADIDFVIIGAAKSATTWLQTQLQSDPQVYMPDPELHYFSRHHDRGCDWYCSQFRAPPQAKLIGEKSNSYLYAPRAAERLHHDLPQVKLIAQLRNPVERAYSSYCMLFRRGEVGPDIEAHLDPSLGENAQLLGSGNFASHLQPYIELFGRERLLILFYEGVREAPERQMARVREHLGLAARPLAVNSDIKVKDKSAPVVPVRLRKHLAWLKPMVRTQRDTATFKAMRSVIARKICYPDLTPGLRERLNDYYAPSIAALEKISGQSLSHWYAPVTSVA